MSTAEARRNARIKKILENSEQRLSKISGVEKKTTVTELDGVKFSYSVDHTDNGITRTSGITEDNIYSNYLEHSFLDSATNNTYGDISVAPANNISNSLDVSNVTQKSKLIHILILAVIQNLILILSDLVQLDGEKTYLGNIFLPLILYNIYFYIFNCPKVSSPSFLDLLLNNHFKLNMTKYLKYSICIIQMMGDMMVYFFTFIVLLKCSTIFN